MSDLETRSIELRADTETGIVEGRAVPFGESAVIGSYTERFAPGSVEPRDDIKLFYQHNEIIGRVLESESREDGFYIKAKISDTALGRDALTLLRDGALSKFSVGFKPLESETDDDGVVVRTKVDIREVSLVAMPAYSSADIQHVRSNQDKEIIVTDSVTPADLDEVRDEFTRKLATFVVTEREPVADTRTGGEILKAITAGDEATIRAYSGGTTADAIMHNNFMSVSDTIVADAAPLRGLFSTGALPATGNTLEFGQMTQNSITAAEQVKEGDALVFGKIGFGVFTAPVKTYGGYTTLSRQEIERSSVPVLNAALQVQSIELGNAINTLIRANYVTQVAAQNTAGNKVTIPASGVKYTDWLNATVDAAVRFAAAGLSLDGLIVSPTEFKSLVALTGSDGRPLFNVSGQAVNTVGNIQVRTLTGDLASVPVYLDPLLASGNVAFFNRLAFRLYESPAYRLQQDDVIHLTRDFSIYEYAAIANETPAGIVPVKSA